MFVLFIQNFVQVSGQSWCGTLVKGKRWTYLSTLTCVCSVYDPLGEEYVIWQETGRLWFSFSGNIMYYKLYRHMYLDSSHFQCKYSKLQLLKPLIVLQNGGIKVADTNLEGIAGIDLWNNRGLLKWWDLVLWTQQRKAIVPFSHTYSDLFGNYWICTPCSHYWFLIQAPIMRHFVRTSKSI